jgi:hypothetical protein
VVQRVQLQGGGLRRLRVHRLCAPPQAAELAPALDAFHAPNAAAATFSAAAIAAATATSAAPRTTTAAAAVAAAATAAAAAAAAVAAGWVCT